MAPSAILKEHDSPVLLTHPTKPLSTTTKTKPTIHATPIIELAFTPYGGLISSNLTLPPKITFPNAIKSTEVVPTTNTYSTAPSGIPGRHVVHVECVETKVPDSSIRTLILERMERHPFTSQSFIPLGGCGKGEEGGVGYLAIVADGNEAGDAPDLRSVRVFKVRGDQGVCYDAGVWHASMHVVCRNTMTFVVVQSLNGVADEDCEFYHVSPDQQITMSF